jgi:hypothetical protein
VIRPGDGFSGPESATGASAGEVSAPGSRWLSIASALLLVLAAIFLFLGNLLIWVNSSVLDSKNFSAAVDDVLDKPEVQDRLANVLAQQAVDSGVIQEEVNTRVPEQVSFLAPVVNGQLETILAEAARRLLATDLAGSVERDLTQRLHGQLLAILTDDQSVLQVQGDSLVFDLNELLDRLFQRAGAKPPQRLQQEADKFGTFVILDDTTGLRQASWLLKNREEIIFGLMAGSVVSFGLAFAAKPDKGKAINATGYAVFWVGVLTFLIIVIGNVVLAQAAPERTVARELLKALEDNLRWQSFGLLVLGACLVVASDQRALGAIDKLESGARSRYDAIDPSTRRYILPVVGGGAILLLLLAA